MSGYDSSALVKTINRHTLGGGVIYTRTDGGSTPGVKLMNVLTDHLGSTDVILTGIWNSSLFAFTSQTTEYQSFDAWGERRDASTQVSYRAGDADPFRTSANDHDRGYTGHEQLDDSGLIHMNGRIYDPELGRFLSPDPVVQIPEYSQNFNRYSYVLNNPLNATDPSGFSFLSNHFHKVGSFIKQYWRTIVVIVVIAVLALTPGGQAFIAPLVGSLSAATGISAAAASGSVIGAIGGGLSSALAGGSLGDILRGAIIGGIQGGITGGILHEADPGSGGLYSNPGQAAAHIAGHGIVGGAANVAMGGKFGDGFLSAAASAGFADAGAYGFIGGTGSGEGVARTTIAGIVGGTASVLGGGKFANGAYTAAFQHLVNAEAAQVGARLTYYVKERLLAFFNPQNGDAAIFQMNSGAGDYRSGSLSTKEYPDMTNDPDYEGFMAKGKKGPAGPIPRGVYRITSNGARPSGHNSYALYPQDASPGNLSISIRNPITNIMNDRSEFMIHLGTPGGIGCVVTPLNYNGVPKGGAPIFSRFESYMSTISRSGNTYGYLSVKGSMYE